MTKSIKSQAESSFGQVPFQINNIKMTIDPTKVQSITKPPFKKRWSRNFLPVSPTFFLHMKQRFFFCFGLSSDLSCSSGVGSAFSDAEANIKKVNENNGKEESVSLPFFCLSHKII